MATRKPAPLEAAALEAYAAKLLHARALTMGELRERMKRRAANAADIDPILRKFRDYGFLDDKRVAENFASARLENRQAGKARVLRDLRQRRVAPELAERTVAQVYSEVDEVALIESYIARKFKNVKLAEYLGEEKNLASAYRKLRYAGFSSGNSIRVLRRFSERAVELEDEAGDLPEA